MAGRGGLNLTHSESLPRFLTRYREAIQSCRRDRSVSAGGLARWSEALGQPTFVGSSGRVFPKALKASPLLRAWLRQLDSLAFRSRCVTAGLAGMIAVVCLFQTPEGPRVVEARATVLALGGASWPRLGSDGSWVMRSRPGRGVSPLKPANCGFTVAWSDLFSERFEGPPLKSIALSFAGRTRAAKRWITRAGIEGGAVYALSAALREAILAAGQATLHIALRPDISTRRYHQAPVVAAR